MIILAGAIILSLNSSNVIEKAGESKTKVDMATIKERIEFIKAEALVNKSNPVFSEIDTENLPIEIDSNTGAVTLKAGASYEATNAYLDLFVETTPESDFDWTEESTSVTITNYKGTSTILKIPSTINGKPVGIGSGAFDSKQLTNVVIPNSVTAIDSGTFYNNKLTSVIIPDSVTFIEVSAFAVNQLTKITIPNSVTYIGPSVFAANKLTTVTIPSSVTSIASDAFAGNPSLTTIRIKKPANSISGYESLWGASNATITWNYTGN